MKLPSLLLVLFSAVTISSAHAAPEAVARGERGAFTPGSEIAFAIEGARPGSGRAISAAAPDPGSQRDDAVDGHSLGGTVRIGADRAPEPDFLSLVR